MGTTTRPRKLRQRTFCDQCRDSAAPGHLEDADGRILGVCPCWQPDSTPEQQREQAMAAAALAHPGSMDAALALIRDAARQYPELSANTIRHILDVAGIPGPVRGPAFAAASNPSNEDHYCIDKCGAEPSGPGSKANGHRIDLYRSRIYRGSLIARDGAR